MILKYMIREEWRIHTSFFGGFWLFPLFILLLSFLGSLAIPILSSVVKTTYMIVFVHYLLAFMGVNVGAFGLFGSEFMNRRFGQASLLAYSSRTLPISERQIFLDFVVKDIIYYFLFWVLPIILGFAVATPFIGVSLGYILLLSVSLSLSFLIGLSIIFLFSTIYAHSIKLLFLTALVIGFLATTVDLTLPTYLYFNNPSFTNLTNSVLVFVIPFILSLIFFKIDFPSQKRHYKNAFGITKYIPSDLKDYIAKDFIDLWRCRGGVGRLLFSFLIPVGLMYLFIGFFIDYIPVVNFLIMFAIFLGVFSSNAYYWLTDYDLFSSYAFLPVKVSRVMKSKVISSGIFNIVSVIIIILTAFAQSELLYLPLALIVYMAFFYFSIASTAYLAGLFPNIMFFNVNVFLKYLAMIMPAALAGILLSLMDYALLALAFFLLLIAHWIMHRGYEKWDKLEQPSY